MEFQYPTIFKNGNRSCPICGKYFIMKDDQGNSHLQSQRLESELGYYKESNKKLQIENNNEKHFSDLINTKLKDHIWDTKQTKEFEIARNKFKKDIQEWDEEIFRLRDHNQKLLLQIKKAKDKVQRNQKLDKIR